MTTSLGHILQIRRTGVTVERTFIMLTSDHSLSNPQPLSTVPSVEEGDQSLALAMVLAQAADDRKAGNVDIYKVAEVTYLTDFLVIVTGYSRTQVRAIAEAMQLQAEQQCDRQPLQKEGESERSWIVLDYGDVMAHIMMPEQRDYYNLEAFWGHGEHILFTSAE